MLCKVVVVPAHADVAEAPWRKNSANAANAQNNFDEPQPIPLSSAIRSRALPNETPRTHQKHEDQTSVLEQRIKKACEEAWEQGHRAGEAAARKGLEDQVRTTLEALAKSAADVAATRPEIIHRAEGDTVRLAVEIARRVLHRELSLDSSALEALMKAAIAKLQNQEIYRVRLHPNQEKTMRSCLEKANRGSSIEIVSDPAQLPGAILFEINRGTLDASIDTQLREIEYGLVDQLRSRS